MEELDKEQNRRLESLEAAGVSRECRINKMDSDINWLKSQFNQVSVDIKEIKDVLILRPSWGVAIALTTLAGLCVSLATYIIFHL
jgi:hypothetical protein